MSYDEKYRKRTIEYRTEGHTISETSQVFKVGITTINSWIKRYKETGEIKDAPVKRRFKKIDPAKLKAYVLAHPDAYQYEISK